MKFSKEIYLAVFALVFSSSVCSAESSLPEGFALVGTSGTFKMVLTPYATYPLRYEEVMPIVSSEPIKYTSKLVHEGQWGDEPGNFGIIRLAKYDMPIDAGPDGGILPEVCVEDSKGNIYTLDIVNNRIQKFDKNGSLICVIPVLSLASQNGVSIAQKIVYPKGDRLYPEGRINYEEKSPPYYIGSDIAISDNDILYYLVRKRNSKGELWEFRDDKLTRKIQGIPGGKKYLASKVNIVNKRIYIDVYNQQEGEDLVYEPLTGKSWIRDNFLKKRFFGSCIVIVPDTAANELLILTQRQVKRVILPFSKPVLLHSDFENLGILADGRIFFTIAHGDKAAFAIDTFALSRDSTSVHKVLGAKMLNRSCYFEYSTPNIWKYEKE